MGQYRNLDTTSSKGTKGGRKWKRGHRNLHYILDFIMMSKKVLSMFNIIFEPYTSNYGKISEIKRALSCKRGSHKAII